MVDQTAFVKVSTGAVDKAVRMRDNMGIAYVGTNMSEKTTHMEDISQLGTIGGKLGSISTEMDVDGNPIPGSLAYFLEID